jgi:cell division transport system permease protein
MARSIREAAAAFRRAPLLTGLSAAMIGLSLFLLGLFGLVAHNVQIVLRQVEERVEVVAYLRDDAPPREVTAARAEIEAWREVRSVRYVSREQALQKARAELPEFRTVFAGLDGNPLPASFEINLQPGQEDADAVRAVADRVAGYAFVEDVRFGSEWLDRVYLLRRVAGVATLVLGIAFATVATLIIGAAVRLAIYARRDEIAIMKLVGATDGYIRRPFLLEGIATGLLGGALALFATYGVFRLLSDSLFELVWIPDSWVMAGLGAGALLGAIASGLAVRRHLRDIAT